MDLLQNFHTVWTENLDKRVAHMTFFVSPYNVPLVMFTYICLVKVVGPKFMENRPPYSLKRFMQFYNIVQIIANTYLVYDFVTSGVTFTELFPCPTSDYTDNDKMRRIIWNMRIYTILKLLDYVETIIFVLRKKQSQVSTLHLYHHITTLFFAWLALMFLCIAPGAALVTMNSFIHMIMYTYYFLAACGPKIQKAIVSLKRWITITQMVQFVFMELYLMTNFIPGCKVVSHFIVLSYMANILYNFHLFYSFYKKTYIKSKKLQ